jgi:hypothetical protein
VAAFAAGDRKERGLERNASRHAAAVAVVAALAAAAFAVFGGAGLAKSGPGKANASQGQYGKKVEVCHKGKRTLRVSRYAWPAHKRHGDSQGTCAELKAKKHKLKKLKKLKKLQAAKRHGTREHGTSKHGADAAADVRSSGHGSKGEHGRDRGDGRGNSGNSNGRGKGGGKDR